MKRIGLIVGGVVVAGILFAGWVVVAAQPAWSPAEVKQIASMSLDALPPLPPDPSNRVADDPAAATLGKAFFFDTRFSGNDAVSCSSCHVPEKQFQDGLARAQAIGTNNRRTMTLAGTAYNAFFFWDGRKDSQWSQALGPTENPIEEGGDRTAAAALVRTSYRADYEAIFGPIPDLGTLPSHATPGGAGDAGTAWNAMTPVQQDGVNRIFANMGKSIAAFERGIMPGRTRFDDFAAALAAGKPTVGILSAQEEGGLRLFIGKGNCTRCHTGPLLTDEAFHNTGVPPAAGLPQDLGRAQGTPQLKADAFNCLGAYSDAGKNDCAELRFVAETPAMTGAFKVPSLRGVASAAPYMHSGQYGTLAQVINHYNIAPISKVGRTELVPLGLTPDEQADLIAFIKALDAPVAVNRPAVVPSG